jgi:hypothetical protein
VRFSKRRTRIGQNRKEDEGIPYFRAFIPSELPYAVLGEIVQIHHVVTDNLAAYALGLIAQVFLEVLLR